MKTSLWDVFSMLLAFKRGRGLKAKAILLYFCILWMLIVLLRQLRVVPSWRRPLLIDDVYLRTEYGVYYCRKGTDDAAIIISPVTEKLKHHIRTSLRDGVFIDVGAHIGLYTIIAARLLAGKGKVIALEPEPSNFEALKINIELNNLDNVIPLNVAAWSESGESFLSISPATIGPRCSLLPDDKLTYKGQKIKIKTKKLDDIKELQNLPSDIPLIIKIDAEGGELYVIQGMIKMLRDHKNIIIIFRSINPEVLRQVTKLLIPHNFSIKRLAERSYLARRCP